MASSATAKKPLRILCFGNSLTGGYPSEHPYALALKAELETAFPTLDVQCTVNGVPGDLVTRGSYNDRMSKEVQKPGACYDWAIVLGGTNDLGWGYQSDRVIAALKKTWDMPLTNGVKVLAMTIPQIKGKFGDLDERRDAVNKAIKEYKKPNYYAFDLFAAVPCRDMDSIDREMYWELDGVHLTAEGYNLMGHKIAEHLIQILNLEEAQSTEIGNLFADARQKRMIDELIFEEERGNPKLLSQGYIVVRKKDLD